MNRYQIAINKQDQYFSMSRGVPVLMMGVGEGIPLSRLLEDGIPERVKIEIPNKRSEETWTTAKIKSTAFVARIDSSQISGMHYGKV